MNQVLIWHYKTLILSNSYLVSWALIKGGLISTARHASAPLRTDAVILRTTNFVGSIAIAWLVREALLLPIKVQDRLWYRWDLLHTALNVYLFPPLFFFYGLYYTDVLSVASVLFAYRGHLAGKHRTVISAGLLSLLFRQTNIFWVSIFLGSLEYCKTIRKGRPGIEFPTQPTFHDVVEGSWQHNAAYDPFISQACFEGHMICCWCSVSTDPLI